MRTTTIAFLIAAGILAAPSFADDARRGAAGERQWLSIPQVHARLEAAGYRNIEKIEREHGAYEVRATDRDDQRVKLYVNPQTGDIADRRGATRSMADRGDARNAPECNKRRCRDDLPKPPAAAPAGK